MIVFLLVRTLYIILYFLQSNLLYVGRGIGYFLKWALVIWLTCLVVIFTTRLGEPYNYDENAPRLRRVHFQVFFFVAFLRLRLGTVRKSSSLRSVFIFILLVEN